MQNEPLLFVQGPPVYIRVVMEEESTSVFELETTLTDDTLTSVTNKSVEQEQLPSKMEPVVHKHTKVQSNGIIKKLQYLATPFPKQAYKPLHFVIGEEVITGEIEELKEQTVIIQLDNPEPNAFVSIEMNDICEVLWRGAPFEMR